MKSLEYQRISVWVSQEVDSEVKNLLNSARDGSSSLKPSDLLWLDMPNFEINICF